MSGEWSKFKSEISNQKQIIDQFSLDTEELVFLRLNLEFYEKIIQGCLCIFQVHRLKSLFLNIKTLFCNLKKYAYR